MRGCGVGADGCRADAALYRSSDTALPCQGQSERLAISSRWEHSRGKEGIGAGRGQRRANRLPRDAPLRTEAAAASRLVPAFPALPGCGKHTLTPVLSSLTENIHFAHAHTPGITGNQTLYRGGNHTPQPPRRRGVASHMAPSTFQEEEEEEAARAVAPGVPGQVALGRCCPARSGTCPAQQRGPSCWPRAAHRPPSPSQAPGSTVVTATDAGKIASNAVFRLKTVFQ